MKARVAREESSTPFRLTSLNLNPLGLQRGEVDGVQGMAYSTGDSTEEGL